MDRAVFDRVLSDEESSVDTVSSLHTIPPMGSLSAAKKRKGMGQQHPQGQHLLPAIQTEDNIINSNNNNNHGQQYVTAQEAAESLIDLALADGSMVYNHTVESTRTNIMLTSYIHLIITG